MAYALNRSLSVICEARTDHDPSGFFFGKKLKNKFARLNKKFNLAKELKTESEMKTTKKTRTQAQKTADYLKDLFHDFGELHPGEETTNSQGIKYRYDMQVIKNPSPGICMAFAKAAIANGARFAKDGFKIGSGKEKIGFGMRQGPMKNDRPERIIMHYLTILD